MKLAVPTPPQWPAFRLPGDRRGFIVPGHADTPDLRVVIGPVAPLPADLVAWAEEVVARDLPEGARVKVVGRADLRSRHGAPLQLVKANLVGADGALLEKRFVALYKLGEQGADVTVRAGSAERFIAHQKVLEELLLSGRLEE